VGEKYGFRIRKVDAATGTVTTLVGNGVPGFGEEGLPGNQTHCNSVEAGIWADPDGTVFWGDCSGRLRRYHGQSGIVTTILGGTGVHDGEPATHGSLTAPAEWPWPRWYALHCRRLESTDPGNRSGQWFHPDHSRQRRAGLWRRWRPRHGCLPGESP